MTIERRFDIRLIAALSLKEKQIQQNYRPIIAIHKWFARRPGALFRGLTLSELADRPLSESYFSSNDFAGKKVADPFMGGGIPLIEANRAGCDVFGCDINPMAAWIVNEEIKHLDLEVYRQAAGAMISALTEEIGDLYRTDCPIYGDSDVPVKYFLWVKVLACGACGNDFDLFPGYQIAKDRRHPRHVVVCSECGELNELEDLDNAGECSSCKAVLKISGSAKRGKCDCPHCGHANAYPRREDGPLKHRLFAIEYYNPARKAIHKGRFFKCPDAKDLAKVEEAKGKWRAVEPRFVPVQEILAGDESNRLHRWGYRYYRELFNERQLLGLELSCRHIADTPEQRIRHALATNLSDLTRYQNMLCRYDTMALKSLDIFSVHGFPVGLVQCESNLLGTINGGGANVGSGGWTNIVDKYAKAKAYCDAPFETTSTGNRKQVVWIDGEWIGEHRPGSRSRKVDVRCTDSTNLALPENSLDAVFTDPPYFGNVQYGELMDFCYAWLRQLGGADTKGLERESSRSPDELTGNETQGRDLAHFAEGLARVYRSMAKALKPGAPLAFTFHHNRMRPYAAIGVAILDAGLVCSMAIPCPAEMGGSIHIHGTGSSIVDTVFVCRSTGVTRRAWMFDSLDELGEVVKKELGELRLAGMKPSAGDIRCIIYGHLTRVAIWELRRDWLADIEATKKLDRVTNTMSRWGDPQLLIDSLSGTEISEVGRDHVAESVAPYAEEMNDAIPF